MSAVVLGPFTCTHRVTCICNIKAYPGEKAKR